QPAREGERGRDLRARNEVHRRGAAVVAAREVAVERRDNRVRRPVVAAAAPPLSDAGSARVGEHLRAERAERAQQSVAIGGRPPPPPPPPPHSPPPPPPP